ncbi:MAG: glutamate mutase L, partial [Desulfurellaceae bacterium]|nr:glutamate mutase L [Desulfurellaceae bacterium]
APIIPTPAAVGMIIETLARQTQLNVIGVDIGGATTDVFSVFRTIFNRTVSANLGMSYSVANVLAEAGLDQVRRWLPFACDEQDLRNQIKNKMIRPTTIPQTVRDLQIEQALAREALRLALEHHKQLAVELKGVQQERTVSDAFVQTASGQSLVDMSALDLIIGSGGILSHAPRRVQAMLMLIDAYEPLGVTRLAVDSIFMMPHLGVLSTVHERAATEVLLKDCLIPLGTCVAPSGRGKAGQPCFSYRLVQPDGQTLDGSLSCGRLERLSLADGREARLELSPRRGFDFGAGPGKALSASVTGGTVGLVFDARGRPLSFAPDEAGRTAQLRAWQTALDLYPDSD